MPWRESSTMSLRREFVLLAFKDGVSVSGLCRRFGVSRKTGYKWLGRYAAEGEAGLEDRSRRPHCSPRRTSTDVERTVLELHERHPAWGGRKLRHRLLNMGAGNVPAASTISRILKRNGRSVAGSRKHRGPYKRFEHVEPNALWQMDFKGDFALDNRSRCHPLSVIDDCSRYCLSLLACDNQREATVRPVLTDVFRKYGLPERMLADNGACWGYSREQGITRLSVWLIRLGIGIVHGRPYHPQTQGKCERFHRTLKAEVIGLRRFRDFADCQRHFDAWVPVYNLERPHESLGHQPPIVRYRPSPREFPESLPTVEYGPGDRVRKVRSNGRIKFRGRLFSCGKAFAGHFVAVRPTCEDGVWSVYFAHQKIARIDEREGVAYTKP